MAAGSDQIKAIGGYFELADREPQEQAFPHDGAVLLNTARNALEYLLLSVGDARKVYVPYYTCSVVFDSLEKLGIPYSLYHTDERLEMADDIVLTDGEYLIVNNYFGIKDAYCTLMAERYAGRIIIDNAQAFFAPRIEGAMQIYSMRKFVGVSDGGTAYTGSNRGLDPTRFECDESVSRAAYLHIRKEQGPEAGFAAYHKSEESLDMQPIRRMSVMTGDILRHIDYPTIASRRKANFAYLHARLCAINTLMINDISESGAPLAYPLLVNNAAELRSRLLADRVFVARYWPNVVNVPGFELEAYLTEHILPLPVDQRYDEADMERIIKIVNNE